MWDCSQQPDFHHCWTKNCMGIPWGIPEIQLFCLKQPILSILRIFQLFKNLKNKFCSKPLWICVRLFTTTWLSPLLSKKLHGNTFRHTWDTVILLKTAKTAYFKHFKLFPATENFKKQILLQTTVNMCETGHNNLTFPTVEQKIAWEYRTVYLRYSDFA